MSQLQKIERVLNRAGRVVANQPNWVTRVEEEACREKALERKRYAVQQTDSFSRTCQAPIDQELRHE